MAGGTRVVIEAVPEEEDQEDEADKNSLFNYSSSSPSLACLLLYLVLQALLVLPILLFNVFFELSVGGRTRRVAWRRWLPHWRRVLIRVEELADG